MSNTFQTLSAGDITRKAIDILHNKLVFTKHINREYDDRFARTGAKNGGSLLIRNPNQFTVRSGAVMDVQDINEDYQTLTVATQRGVDLNFTDYELTMSLDDFSDRILEPAMARLASEVDNVVYTGCYKAVYNHIITAFGTLPDHEDLLSVRARLNKGLAPTGDRYFVGESLAMNGIITDTKALFHPAGELETALRQGYLGRMAGFDFLETEMVPSHTNGTRTDTTPVCNTSTGITSGTATVAITSFGPSGGTVKEGDIFTIEDVYAVNPETKERYGHLQQFVVTADKTATATSITVAVSPTPITSGAKQNVELVSAGASKSVSWLTPGDGSGAASTAYPQNIAFHRDAFTMVTADLVMPKDAHMAHRDVYDGIAMRFWQGSDIVNDKFPARFDVLFGYKAIRPEWAVRIPGKSV